MARKEREVVTFADYYCDARGCTKILTGGTQVEFERSGWRQIEVKRLSFREPNMGTIVTSIHLCGGCFADLVERC